jgi:hypothetical protein
MTILAITAPYQTELTNDLEISKALDTSKSGLKIHDKISPIFCGEASYWHVISNGRSVQNIRRALEPTGLILMTERFRHPN